MALRDSLVTLLGAARATGGEHEIRLVRGLVINVRARGDVVTLTLRRRSATPSFVEWKTVLDHWPEPIEYVNPEKVGEGNRIVLRGRLRRYVQVPLIVDAVEPQPLLAE